MKALLFIFSIFLTHFTFAQDSLVIRQTDSIVASINNTQGEIVQCRIGNIEYTYKKIKTLPVKYIASYQIDGHLITETYYLHFTAPIFFVESDSSDLPYWRGTYYIKEGLIIYFETLGHGKSETEEWDPQKEFTAKFQKVKSDIVQCAQEKKQSETFPIVDTNIIAILPFTSGKKNTIQHTLSNEDIQLIEKLLTENTKEKNLILKNYKRQYQLYIDDKNNRKVFVNCFCYDNTLRFKDWKTRLVLVEDGGRCFFQSTINLTNKTCEYFKINGKG